MNKQEAKELLQNNLDYLQSLNVPEYILYRKWTHMNTNSMKNWFFQNKNKIEKVKNKIWIPRDNYDYLNLNIDVIPANTKELLLQWRILREMTHSAVWHSSPGRMARFIVVNKTKERTLLGSYQDSYEYLGIISLGSDFIGIGGRDKVIGWEKEHKMKYERLKYTAMGSSISPTQPLGYNYLGGKLVALMVCSDKVENFWNSKYKEPLSGITTTSLFGGYSQYNRLKYWKKCKSSEGKVKLEPTEDIYEQLKEWYKEEFPEDYEKTLKGSHPKARLLGKIYKELSIKTYENNAPRGVYWCPLYTNTNSFLRCESEKLGEKLFNNDVESLSDLWKDKYATKRIKKLEQENNVSNDRLFYDDLIDKDWEEVRSKYIINIGR